jgi:hypothetical protein
VAQRGRRGRLTRAGARLVAATGHNVTRPTYKPADKLRGKVALVTGGDSGIGRAVAIAYAIEGADVAIAFNHSEDNAADTRRMVGEIQSDGGHLVHGSLLEWAATPSPGTPRPPGASTPSTPLFEVG